MMMKFQKTAIKIDNIEIIMIKIFLLPLQQQ
jgi:hypothetical protein